MDKQIENTNRAFQRRIWEEIDAKSKLETQVKDVTKLIDNMEENIKNVEKAILDKENYLKLAHTRLDVRTNRPHIELVRDPAQYKLVKEVQEIEDSIRRLQERLNESHRKLKDLDRDKLVLLKDIEVKANTIQLDEAENFNGIRKSLKINQFWVSTFCFSFWFLFIIIFFYSKFIYIFIYYLNLKLETTTTTTTKG